MSVTDLVQVRASAVPSVPRQISASQRLAALELAQRINDLIEYRIVNGGCSAIDMALLTESRELLRELAGDAKGER